MGDHSYSWDVTKQQATWRWRSGWRGGGMLYNWRTHKKDLKGTNGLVLSQVKGGSFHLGDLRDFLHTVEREKASFGVFITLNKVNSNNAKAEMQTAGEGYKHRS